SRTSSRASSLKTASESSFSLHTDSDSDDSDNGLLFPGYSTAVRHKKDVQEAPPSSPVHGQDTTSSPADGTETSPASPPDPPPHSEDDSAVRPEPSHHVDYLSYDWREEDIWSSWRHIVEHRKVYGERSRLENASWRTWAKNQFNLKTVSPETLNWLKEYDVTWLYGPLQPASNRTASQQASEPPSRLSKTNSFLHKKPILKKRSMSEVMLQRSISASSLVKQAAAAVQAQQRAVGTPLERRKPRSIIHTPSDFITSLPTRSASRDPTDYFTSRSTSGLQTPDGSERKHIRFDEKVEQCIAVDCKTADDDYEDDNDWTTQNSDSDDDCVVMMKRTKRKRPLFRTSSSKASVSSETKIIEKLEPTTLKSQTDSPEVPGQHPGHSLYGYYRSSRLSPSPSQETIRPSNPSTNFLLAEEDDDGDWESESSSEQAGPSTSTFKRPSNTNLAALADASEGAALKRTASGMFMPLEDNDESAAPGIIGKVVDTVNTARDIAHVIWNVGWRN
ncbi:hypothetical protein M011DRAFT_391825, partial [Sporormia fimetaria CBS 119925]